MCTCGGFIPLTKPAKRFTDLTPTQRRQVLDKYLELFNQGERYYSNADARLRNYITGLL